MEIWRSKRPYQNVYDWSNEFRKLIQSSTKPWMPDMVDEISDLCNLDASLARQLPRRIMRTLIKLSLAITQQRFIFHKHSSDMVDQFDQRSRHLLITVLNR